MISVAWSEPAPRLVGRALPTPPVRVPALRRYLDDNGLTFAGFGRSIGVSHSAVHRYVHGLRLPSRKIMARIATATGGRVTANDFFLSPEPASGAAA